MSPIEMQTDVKTYRGRTLEELLPQIRTDLGPDAIVLRRREGVAGGIGGFFARPFVEVEARPPLPADAEVEARNDRATTEGLRAPAIQALVEQAAPFADALARAETTVSERAGDVMLASAGLYGPQPNVPLADDDVLIAARASDPTAAALRDAALASRLTADALRQGTPAADPAAPLPGASRPAAPFSGALLSNAPDAAAPPPGAPRPAAADAPAPLPGALRPAAADAAEQRLVAAGLSAGLAADVVGEAVAHGLPFGSPRGFKKLVRSALARRIPVLADLGPDRRVIAVAGAGGAGKTALIARLAAAYAAAGHEVVVVALGDSAAELAPLGIDVVAADDAAEAARRLRGRAPLVTLVDTPALGVRDGEAAAALATELRALGCTEVQLALPATLSAAAADELATALAPLRPTHVALTHADQTACPGAAIELAIRTRLPLSYVSARDEVAPADPAELASRLLP